MQCTMKRLMNDYNSPNLITKAFPMCSKFVREPLQLMRKPSLSNTPDPTWNVTELGRFHRTLFLARSHACVVNGDPGEFRGDLFDNVYSHSDRRCRNFLYTLFGSSVFIDPLEESHHRPEKSLRNCDSDNAKQRCSAHNSLKTH